MVEKSPERRIPQKKEPKERKEELTLTLSKKQQQGLLLMMRIALPEFTSAEANGVSFFEKDEVEEARQLYRKICAKNHYRIMPGEALNLGIDELTSEDYLRDLIASANSNMVKAKAEYLLGKKYTTNTR